MLQWVVRSVNGLPHWDTMPTRNDITGHEISTSRAGAHRGRFACGMTLLEVMMAASILVVASLGALHCQYYVAGHGKVAGATMAAANTAQLLLEDWKSTGGSLEYDPSDLGLGFSSAQAIPSGFATPEGLGAVLHDGVHSIVMNNVPMLVMLKYLDVNSDDLAKTTLRQLAVVVHFEAPANDGEDTRFSEMPPVTLVTYTRLDASNG